MYSLQFIFNFGAFTSSEGARGPGPARRPVDEIVFA